MLKKIIFIQFSKLLHNNFNKFKNIQIKIHQHLKINNVINYYHHF